MAGSFFRVGLRFPPLRALDSAGGLVLGAAAGLALVWVFGAAALLVPGQQFLRDVQRSEVMRQLNEIVPPTGCCTPSPASTRSPRSRGRDPAGPLDRPDRRQPRRPGGDPQRRARARLRVWAGYLGQRLGRGPRRRRHRRSRRRGRAARRSSRSDERLARRGDRVRPEERRRGSARAGLSARRSRSPSRTRATVGIVGYPLNGPLDVEPGRIGRTAKVLTDDAYGHGPVERTITSLAGGCATATPAARRSTPTAASSDGFATRVGGTGGYGIPAGSCGRCWTRGPVSTGACAP